jgi:hypothetical protein
LFQQFSNAVLHQRYTGEAYPSECVLVVAVGEQLCDVLLHEADHGLLLAAYDDEPRPDAFEGVLAAPYPLLSNRLDQTQHRSMLITYAESRKPREPNTVPIHDRRFIVVYAVKRQSNAAETPRTEIDGILKMFFRRKCRESIGSPRTEPDENIR